MSLANYFLGGINDGDKFTIVTTNNNILYTLCLYTNGTTQTLYFDSGFFSSTNPPGSSISLLIFGFSSSTASNNAEGGNMALTSTNDLGINVTSGLATIAEGVGQTLNITQGNYSFPATLITGVDYTITDTSGNPINFNYTVGPYNSDGSPDLATTPTTFPIYFVSQSGCVNCTGGGQGQCGNDSSTAYVATLNAYCVYNNTEEICTTNNPVLPTLMFTNQDDCINGVEYEYCSINTTCGASGCNGICTSSSDMCKPNSQGIFACSFEATKKDWVLLAVCIVILFIALFLLFIFLM